MSRNGHFEGSPCSRRNSEKLACTKDTLVLGSNLSGDFTNFSFWMSPRLMETTSSGMTLQPGLAEWSYTLKERVTS